MRALLLALTILLPLLAGCLDQTAQTSSTTAATSLTPSTEPLSEAFDAGTALPAGWNADDGEWVVAPDATAPSAPNVLRGTGGGGRSTLQVGRAYQDFEATLTFQMVSGDEGAGLSFHYRADGEYRIVRYSIREEGWHYFIMKDAADKPYAATVDQQTSRPQLGEWVTLRVRVEGQHVQAWHGDVLVIDYMDPDPPQAGGLGPFLRGSAVALFDDLHAAPL